MAKGSVLNTVLILGVVGVGGYLAWKWYEANPNFLSNVISMIPGMTSQAGPASATTPSTTIPITQYAASSVQAIVEFFGNGTNQPPTSQTTVTIPVTPSPNVPATEVSTPRFEGDNQTTIACPNGTVWSASGPAKLAPWNLYASDPTTYTAWYNRFCAVGSPGASFAMSPFYAPAGCSSFYAPASRSCCGAA